MIWICEPQFGLLNSIMNLLGLPRRVLLGNKFLALPSIIFMQILTVLIVIIF